MTLTSDTPPVMPDGPDEVPQDKLEGIKHQVKRLRDLQLRLQDAEDLAKGLKASINEMEHRVLPDLMAEAGVPSLMVEADGNQPVLEIRSQPYYKAVLPANDEDRAAAVQWLEDNGHGDLVKVELVSQFGRGDVDQARRVEKVLQEMEVSYSSRQNVPWQTLTAFVKEQVQKGRALSSDTLALLGAHVGTIVKIKEIKNG